MNKSYWKNKKILVTGVEGFVGSYFFVELQKRGVKVIGSVLKKEKSKEKKSGIKSSSLKEKIIELNVLDQKRLKSVCKSEKINLIIHCAALDGNPEFKKNNSERIIDENIRMALNILNAAKENKIKELIIISSAEIYSAFAKSPIKEEDDYRKIFPEIKNGYVAAKVAIEILAALYAEQFGLKIMLPRPTNIYGLGDKTDSGSSRVIPSMIKSILANKPIEIWGDGNQVRSFIYIDDFIWSIMSLLEKKEYSIVNIATTESISIKNLAKLIAKILKSKAKLTFDTSKMVGVRKRVLSINKLNSLIDFRPLSLSDGLKRTLTEKNIKQ